MKETSALNNQIIASPNHWFEVGAFIGGLWYSANKIMSISTRNLLFANGIPEVGCAVSGEVDIAFIWDGAEIPKMGEVFLNVRPRNETQVGDWISAGAYYIDTREVSHNSDGLDVMVIHGYDSMLKFEQMYPSDSTHDYPLLDTELLQFMANKVNVSIDPRTWDVMNYGYTFTPFGYTMREMLCYIASAYGGNFTITDDGNLLLIQLGGEPVETFYLVDESGNAITFGGNRILV